MAPFGATLDANVLFPIALCDTLLRAAVERLYRPSWSTDILDELERTLVEHRRATSEAAKRRRQLMQDALPAAMVTGYKDLLPGLHVAPSDRHVLAAAIGAGARVIVTQNMRHFPRSALAPYDIEAQSADTFLQYWFDLEPETMARIIQEQARDLRRPPQSVEQVLTHLRADAPSFVRLIQDSGLLR